MASILKVDQLQKPDGSTPTAADLGLNDAGRIVNQETRSIAQVNASLTANVWVDGFSTTYTPVEAGNTLIISCLVEPINGAVSRTKANVEISVDGTGIVEVANQSRDFSWASINMTGHTTTTGSTMTIKFRFYSIHDGTTYLTQLPHTVYITEISQ
jgi:hypothetical protein